MFIPKKLKVLMCIFAPFYIIFVIVIGIPTGFVRFLIEKKHNLKDMENILNTQPGFVRADWCGDEACELKIKEIKGCKSRCILENEPLIDGKCVCCGKDAKHHVIWGIQY